MYRGEFFDIASLELERAITDRSRRKCCPNRLRGLDVGRSIVTQGILDQRRHQGDTSSFSGSIIIANAPFSTNAAPLI